MKRSRPPEVIAAHMKITELEAQLAERDPLTSWQQDNRRLQTVVNDFKVNATSALQQENRRLEELIEKYRVHVPEAARNEIAQLKEIIKQLRMQLEKTRCFC